MVLSEKSELPQIFADVKSAAAENADTPTVLIIASHSIDSLAACTMLARLFEDELISHKVVSVTDYAELSRVYREQVIDAAELRSIFLINNGGIIDLMSHLQQALDEADGDEPSGRLARNLPHPDCRWYILDSHRPYSLENIYHDPHEEEPPNVFVIHDGEQNEDLDDILSQLTILQDASEGEDSDEEDYEPPAQRRRVSQAEYGSMSPDSQRDRRKWLKRLTRRYYGSSWHGTAASLLCYSLVQSLNKSQNELLWLSIVGLTDQLVHERIEYEKYVGEAQVLQAEVGALNQDGGDETREVAGEDGGPSVSVKQHIQSRLRLDSVQELRLSLMRHWTVYEALQHSPYIASRLGLYQQRGRDKLDEWLARMGIPLEECKQEYQYMRKQFKGPLFEKMLQYGNEFGLCHLTYPSFRCVTSYGNTQLAAADLVSGVAAVLENYDALEAGGFAGGAFAAAQKALLSGMRDGLERATREGVMRDGIERAKEMLRATVRALPRTHTRHPILFLLGMIACFAEPSLFPSPLLCSYAGLRRSFGPRRPRVPKFRRLPLCDPPTGRRCRALHAAARPHEARPLPRRRPPRGHRLPSQRAVQAAPHRRARYGSEPAVIPDRRRPRLGALLALGRQEWLWARVCTRGRGDERTHGARWLRLGGVQGRRRRPRALPRARCA